MNGTEGAACFRPRGGSGACALRHLSCSLAPPAFSRHTACCRGRSGCFTRKRYGRGVLVRVELPARAHPRLWVYIADMSRHEKLLLQILRGTSDANISFEGLRSLLRVLGFEERIRGSHHIFTQEGVEEILNLQPRGSLAKPYQVRQVRQVILKYKLAGEEP